MTTEIPPAIAAYMSLWKELTQGIAANLFNIREKRRRLRQKAKKIDTSVAATIFHAKNPAAQQIRQQIEDRMNNLWRKQEDQVLLDAIGERYEACIIEAVEEAIINKENEKLDRLYERFPEMTIDLQVGYRVIDDRTGENVKQIASILSADRIDGITQESKEYEKEVQGELKTLHEKQKTEAHIRAYIQGEPYGYSIFAESYANIHIGYHSQISYEIMDELDEVMNDLFMHTYALTDEDVEEWGKNHPTIYPKLKLLMAAQHPKQKTLPIGGENNE